jgi:hypothetical protein
VDVTVTTPGGTSPTSSADRFTYQAPLPTVTSLSPSSGPTAGGTKVTITGSGFTGASAVHFGTAAATGFSVNSDTQITAVSPSQPSGAVDVTVTTPRGTSATGAADRFTYTATGLPQITRISGGDNPCTGCAVVLNTAGGSVITISGSGFTGATGVRLDTTQYTEPATSFTVVNDSTITAVTPPTPTSAVLNIDIRVLTPAGISPTTPADVVSYNF